MKKLIFALCELLALAGCKQTSSDGYIFEKKQYTQTDMTVHVVEEESLRDMQLAYAKERNATDLPSNEQLMAFSVLHRNTDGTLNCTIHIIDPLVHYYPEFIGHEFTHCVFGQFHPNQ